MSDSRAETTLNDAATVTFQDIQARGLADELLAAEEIAAESFEHGPDPFEARERRDTLSQVTRMLHSPPQCGGPDAGPEEAPALTISASRAVLLDIARGGLGSAFERLGTFVAAHHHARGVDGLPAESEVWLAFEEVGAWFDTLFSLLSGIANPNADSGSAQTA